MRNSHHGGFVLISVLWVLVIMVLAASSFSLWVDKVREQAFLRQQSVEAYRRATDTLAKVTYSHMTGLKTSEGIAWPDGRQDDLTPQFQSLDDFMSGAMPVVTPSASGFMRMDGAVIDAGGGVRVMIQDRAGLIGLSFLSDPRIFTAMSSIHSLGKISPDQLADALFDYQDSDSIRLLQGAERQNYLQQGMYAPANGALRWPMQLRHIMGWSNLLNTSSDAYILQVFKVEGAGVVNANTASKHVLELVVGGAESAEAIINTREQKRFDRVSQLTPYVGGSEETYLSVMPESGFRFWWWHQGDAVANVYDVQFAPLESGTRAWYFNWSARVNLPDELATITPLKIDHPFFD